MIMHAFTLLKMFQSSIMVIREKKCPAYIEEKIAHSFCSILDADICICRRFKFTTYCFHRQQLNIYYNEGS